MASGLLQPRPDRISACLANNGERIRLQDAIGQKILDFEYKDGWRPITDGDGYSLIIIDETNGDVNSWSEKDSWRASDFYGGSPGEDDPGILPNPGAVVINEVLSHSHEGPDWIELHNTTNSAIDIGGWFLSDSGKDDADLMKYRIADGKTIAKNNYIVFYEDSDFNNPGDPACIVPFALSENGDQVYLSSYIDAYGKLTGYREVEDFAASATNVSFGRYFKSSTGSFNFVAIPPGVQVVGGYDGWLSNGGESLQLGLPGDTDELGRRYYIRIDRVNYSDGSHPEDCRGGVDYWPVEADGGGKSLSRIVQTDYGNDVANWQAAAPSPGLANP